MSTTRVGAVIDALVTTFGTGTAAAVYDGTPVVSTAPGDFVIVGSDGASDTAASFTQEWAGLGAHARNEEADIPCLIVSQSGDTDAAKTHRDRVLTILEELATAYRADPTLGGVVQSGWIHITSGSLGQSNNTNGSRAEIPITVHYQARI